MEEDAGYWSWDQETASFVTIKSQAIGGGDVGDNMDIGEVTSKHSEINFDISQERAVEIVVEAFRSAAERGKFMFYNVYISFSLSVCFSLYKLKITYLSYFLSLEITIGDGLNIWIVDKEAHNIRNDSVIAEGTVVDDTVGIVGNQRFRVQKLFFSLPKH